MTLRAKRVCRKQNRLVAISTGPGPVGAVRHSHQRDETRQRPATLRINANAAARPTPGCRRRAPLAGLSGTEAELDTREVELAMGGQLVLFGLPRGGFGGVHTALLDGVLDD